MAVTKKSDLHTDAPLRPDTRISESAQTRPRGLAYDIVIGQRRPVGGSSLASTAMTRHKIDFPPSTLVEKVREGTREPRHFTGTGFGGHGINFRQIASARIAAKIAGRGDADDDLFALRRSGAARRAV